MAESFGVVAAVGLTFFGLMLIAAQDVGVEFGLGGGSEPAEMSLYSTNIGEVGDTNTDIRTVDLGSFTVSEAQEPVNVFSRRDVSVKKSLTSGDSLSFSYNATDPSAANFFFDVLGKDGDGKLYIEVNGERVFEQDLVSGGSENIQIEDGLKPGNNSFRIGTTSGGIASETTYRLEDLEVSVTDRSEGLFTDRFRMYDYELQNGGFIGANLSYRLPIDTAVPTEPLEVSVNDNTIFSSRSARSRQSIEIERSETDLVPASNTVTFETESEAEYRVEDADITVRYVAQTEPTVTQRQFDLTQDQISYAERGDTSEEMRFDYQLVTGNPDLLLELNEFNTTISPTNGENSVDVPSDALESSNTFRVRGQGSYSIENLRLVSEEDDS